MAKFFRKVQEVTGMVQGTSDPEPVQSAKDELKQLKNIHSKVSSNSKVFADSLNRVGTAKINTTFSDWSQLENGREPPSKIGPLLERIAELQNAVDSLHLALSSQVQESMVAPFRKFVEADCRAVQSLSSKQEDARLDYDMTLNSYKSVEKKTGAKWEEKKKAAEATMNLACSKYEQLNDELVEESQRLNVRSQILVQEQSLQYIRALEHHFEAGKKMMDNLKGFTAELESSVGQLKEAEAEMLRQQQEAHASAQAAAAETAAATEAGMGEDVPPPYSPEAVGPDMGAPPPGYDAGAPPPGYSDAGAPPGYDSGAPPPSYAPGYDQPPGYPPSVDGGAPPPGYDGAPTYGAAPPAYDTAPPPGYDGGAPPPAYDGGAPPPSYDGGAPPPAYATQPPTYGGAPPAYGEAPPAYDGAPPPQYDG